MAAKKNWYFFYDRRGFAEDDLNDLGLILKKKGYGYQPLTGLGAGPGSEQLIVIISNSEFLSTVAVGLLTNLVYDLLKTLYFWLKTHRCGEGLIPIVKIMLHFDDIDNKRTRAELEFRIDKKYYKKSLKNQVESRIRYLNSSSNSDQKCVVCAKSIPSNTLYFIDRLTKKGPICGFCFDE